MYIVLVYDIKMDEGGARSSRNIFKICKKYLTHIQNSVFEGELSAAMLRKLQYELDDWIRKDRDSVLVFKSQSKRWMQKEFWGEKDDLTSNFF